MTTLTTGEAATAGAIVGSALVGVALFSLAILVLTIIAGWKIFKKAGQPGWKILIPIYNVYIFFKIVGMNFWGWFLAIFCTSFVAGLIGSIQYEVIDGTISIVSMNPIGMIFYCASSIIALVSEIIFSIRLAKAFKKGAGFAVGLIFLPFIFELILAFGPAKYDKKAALKK